MKWVTKEVTEEEIAFLALKTRYSSCKDLFLETRYNECNIWFFY